MDCIKESTKSYKNKWLIMYKKKYVICSLATNSYWLDIKKKIGSGGIFTGFSALYCDAWNNRSDCEHPGAANGWEPCKPSLQHTMNEEYHVGFDLSAKLVLFRQGDKARVIQTLLFMSGINTLLQTLIGSRLPVVMGASFAFVIPVLSIINDYSDQDFATDHEVCTLRC